MKQIRWIIIAFIGTVLFVNLSCSRNQYDPVKHEEYVDSFLPVDTIDAMHSWMLTSTKPLSVKANVSVGAKRVQILSANPRGGDGAEVLAEAYIEDGEEVQMTVCCPSTLTTLYAALVDEEENYTLTEFDSDKQRTVDFSNPLFVSQPLSYTPQPQEFVYGFEEKYPEPGDYDYNGVVLHISQQRTGEYEMRFNVTLAAVGTQRQVGACINLLDYKYNEIESVTTVNGESFNVNNGNEVSDQMVYVMRNPNNNDVIKDVFQSGGNGEAIINLFVDAHWATGDVLTENYGQITRKKYNVSKSSGTDAQVMVPRTVSYLVTFKDNKYLNHLTLGRIDPFIVEENYGGRWEVHTYDCRKDKIYFNYTYTDMQVLPWAIVVPSRKYRHPLDGVVVGYMKEGYLFGAYSTFGHSFGEWTADHTASLDWYEYPTETRVF